MEMGSHWEGQKTLKDTSQEYLGVYILVRCLNIFDLRVNFSSY